MAANTADVMRKAMELAQAQLSRYGTASLGSSTSAARPVNSVPVARNTSSRNSAPQRIGK